MERHTQILAFVSPAPSHACMHARTHARTRMHTHTHTHRKKMGALHTYTHVDAGGIEEYRHKA